MFSWLTSFNWVAFAISNAFWLILGYIAIGIAFTFIRWTISLFRVKRDVEGITEEQITKWMDRWSAKRDRTEAIASLRISAASKSINCSKYPPTAKENAGIISLWAIFWPIVLLWTMFHDIVVEVSNYMVRKFQSLYQKLATAILPE